MKKTAKIIYKTAGILLAVLLLIVTINVTEPLFCEKNSGSKNTMDPIEAENQCAGERIRCIDDNEEALLWRLRMIADAKKSIVLATFDLRPDESGTDIMAALYQAAQRGVHIRLLLDGIYEIPFLRGSTEFSTLASHENVEAGIYNPISLKNIFRLNYRMHDKYLMIDDCRYLLGGRNTNDIFLGNYKKDINIDRDILVCEDGENGNSMEQLMDYFSRIWNEPCVRRVKPFIAEKKAERQKELFWRRYQKLAGKYDDMETYHRWNQDTFEVESISLLSNGIKAAKKSPVLLNEIGNFMEKADRVIIQTPYVICDNAMYGILKKTAAHADLRIILNAVEKGSNPWGCTDYLNHKKDLQKTGASIYELMNEKAVHTKTILVDDHISLVGSYNFDMRSTYLDTELMLVIESKELNAHLESMNEVYMKKSRKVCPDGTQTEGILYREKKLSAKRQKFYRKLQIIVRPIRHLL
ncbi:MAG: phosphatidylserine/phosphatidylglycerophosphate/cardiolipin synthase family protein [Lachnospiraceae bacterium]|nr:phosphatidylserine/phosphatidylglycerophosphate/cardiolipin synthase family protein [Lachnospiraceae bacterium]MDY5496745.1 phosphatidylserine/phosphatidylglycerophosphate/cardiolipin synthase family protein [Anaerobutyricum sp.]